MVKVATNCCVGACFSATDTLSAVNENIGMPMASFIWVAVLYGGAEELI